MRKLLRHDGDHRPATQPPQEMAELFARNRRWAEERVRQDPMFFTRLAHQQDPNYLWIGCSDSRVPANEILGLDPGEVFVHRNVANLIVHSDMNSLSVLHFAINRLRVKHIMVVGHYGCSGIRAVCDGIDSGIANSWLGHVEDIAEKHGTLLRSIDDPDQRASRLVELNVLEQVMNVCRSQVVREAWRCDKKVFVHGLVYSIHDGILRPAGVSIKHPEDVWDQYNVCLRSLSSRESIAST